MHARVSRQGLPAFSCTPPSFAIVVNRTLKKGEKKNFYSSLCQTQHSFSVTSFTLGFRLFFNLLQINLPRLNLNFGDHLQTCQAKSAATQAHDWVVRRLGGILSSVGHRVKVHNITPASGKERGDVEMWKYGEQVC
jgi:hypothetical protein